MRYLLLILLLLSSCDVNEDRSTATEDAQVKNEVTQNWIQEGVCEVANQVKMHGAMNCVVVKWQCPKCRSQIEDLKWKLCKSCCSKLNICKVCNRKIK